MAPLSVEDRMLIKALRIEKGWRCGSNYCKISCQTVETTHVFVPERTCEQPFLVTMSTSTNEHRYIKNKLLGLLLPPPRKKTWREISNFIVKKYPIFHVHRQFNDRYINSFIINVHFRRCIFQGLIAL